jgi:hypothetical protein
MKEQRKFERFNVAVPARMEMITSAGSHHSLDVQTKDISAAGAFLNTSEHISKGTRFRLRFTLPSEKIKELTGTQSLIKAEGTVVRATSTGVAVCFDGECQIFGLKKEDD